MATTHRRRAVAAGCMGILLAGALAIAGNVANNTASADPALKDTPVFSAVDYDPNGPVVKEVGGVLIQRTPNSAGDYGDYQPNIDYLDADSRGCGSCHDDLEVALYSLRPHHVGMLGGYDGEWHVDGCVTCHSEITWIGTIAPTIHAIHTDVATCGNCHEIDMATGEYKLWEEVKYDHLWGISADAAPVLSNFAFDQTTLSEDGLPKKNWVSREYDVVRYEKYLANEPLDETMLDTWTISISGCVDNEITWTVRELMENAPVVTKIITQHCEINPTNHDIIGTAEVTGVPLSWVLEQAGLTEGAMSVQALSPNGEAAGYWGVNLTTLAEHDAILAYEINGEPLSWMDGYPACIFFPGIDGARNTKSLSEIVVSDQMVPEFYTGSGLFGNINYPNAGILNTREGQIVQAGVPYTLEGWVDGWGETITAVEVSFDRGATWTRFETPDCNQEAWVHFTLDWTPAADVDTAYVIQVRGVAWCTNVAAIGGEPREMYTEVPATVMVNAKADMSSIEVTE